MNIESVKWMNFDKEGYPKEKPISFGIVLKYNGKSIFIYKDGGGLLLFDTKEEASNYIDYITKLN